jgi:hypothetical protein
MHVTLRRRRENDLLGTNLDLQLGLLPLREHARGLLNVVRTTSSLWNGRKVLRVENVDLDSIYDKVDLVAILLGSHSAWV